MPGCNVLWSLILKRRKHEEPIKIRIRFVNCCENLFGNSVNRMFIIVWSYGSLIVNCRCEWLYVHGANIISFAKMQ